MLNKTQQDLTNASFLPRIERLAKPLKDPGYRKGYWTQQLRAFLGTQVRALRGDMSQKEFGQLIGKPQNVVSRIENENYGGLGLQTLIDIATKLDITLVVRFADWPTFLRTTEDYSDAALKPAPYSSEAIDQLVSENSAIAADAKLRKEATSSRGLASFSDAMRLSMRADEARVSYMANLSRKPELDSQALRGRAA